MKKMRGTGRKMGNPLFNGSLGKYGFATDAEVAAISNMVSSILSDAIIARMTPEQRAAMNEKNGFAEA